jgi:adenylate cyclase
LNLAKSLTTEMKDDRTERLPNNGNARPTARLGLLSTLFRLSPLVRNEFPWVESLPVVAGRLGQAFVLVCLGSGDIMAETRRLAAILAADVVGFSRMTGADEDRTLARLRTLRSDLIDPTIAVHNGHVFKRTGDGTLIEFRSVVDAVRCAIEVQNGMVERNAGLPPERRIEFRVGIHLGDVVEESDGDLMGDGINIAARLEGIATPGAICLSEDAYRQVKARLDLVVTDLGATQLKNIAEPIHAYSLAVGAPTPPKSHAQSPPQAPASKPRGALRYWPALAAVLVVLALAAGTYSWRSGLAPRLLGLSLAEDKLASAPRLSIVVLPFANLSSDPEQDYFADAITEDLTTDISHLADSFVIARNTAFTYKGKPVDMKAMGRELGVRYALEGSVRRVGEAITVNAQLISTETGAHVWADRFEGERAKLGQLQVEVVARLANALNVELVRAESLRAIRERPDNPDAVDLAMRGGMAGLGFSAASNKEASDYYERALKLDPNLLRAKIGLAGELSLAVIFGWSSSFRADAERAEKLANEGLSAEPDNALAHQIKAVVYQALVLTRGGAPSDPLWEAGIAEADEAVKIDRNFAAAHATSGWYRLFLGRAAEAFAGVETAMKLSPRDPSYPFWEYFICHLHGHLAQWDQAIEHCRLAAQALPNVWYHQLDLTFVNAWLGHDSEAKAALANLLKLKPGFSVKAEIEAGAIFSDNPVYAQQIARMAEGLRKAGLPVE